MNAALASLKQFEIEDQWFKESFNELQESFANKFVAVKNQEVIATSRKSDELIEKAREKTKDLTKVLIEFVPEKGLVIIV